MIGSFFGGGVFGRRGAPFPPVQADRPLYAVGDVHGRADLLVSLIDQIMQDVANRDASGIRPELVFVGDLVDRGQDSRSVIEFLVAIQDWTEIETTFLVGNHEIMLLQFLHDPVAGRRWLRFGGYETLQSYGLGRIGDIGDEAELHRIAAELNRAMGPHLAFIENLRPWHANGNLLITHAGADPALAPSEQTIDALVWGVPSFHQQVRTDGLWVVHGHTIVEKPCARDGRISIDTGAYRTGTLTALRVIGGDVSFLSATGAASTNADDFDA